MNNLTSQDFSVFVFLSRKCVLKALDRPVNVRCACTLTVTTDSLQWLIIVDYYGSIHLLLFSFIPFYLCALHVLFLWYKSTGINLILFFMENKTYLRSPEFTFNKTWENCIYFLESFHPPYLYLRPHICGKSEREREGEGKRGLCVYVRKDIICSNVYLLRWKWGKVTNVLTGVRSISRWGNALNPSDSII